LGITCHFQRDKNAAQDDVQAPVQMISESSARRAPATACGCIGAIFTLALRRGKNRFGSRTLIYRDAVSTQGISAKAIRVPEARTWLGGMRRLF